MRRFAVALVALVLAVATPAAAQDLDPTEAPSDTLELLELDAVLDANGAVIRLATNAPGDRVIEVRYFPALDDAAGLDAHLGDASGIDPIEVAPPLPVGLLDPGDIRLPLAPPGVGGVGVWPVTIVLRTGDGTELDRIATVVLAPPAGPVPVIAPVALVPGNPAPLDPPSLDGPTRRALQSLVAAVEAQPALPWTIGVGGTTAEALDASVTDAGLRREVQAVADEHQIAALPSVDVDLGGIAAADLTVVVPAIADLGTNATRLLFGAEPDLVLWPLGPEDRDGASSLVGLVDATLVDADVVGSRVPVDLDVGPVGLPVVDLDVTGPGVDRVDADVVAAARFWLDVRPPSPGLAIRPGEGDLATVLDATEEWGTARAGTLAELLAAGGRQTAATTAGPSEDLTVVAERLPLLTARLFRIVPMVGETSPRYDDVAHAIARAVATGVADDDRRAALDRIGAFVTSIESAVSVGGNTTITLTSRTGTIPVTLRNAADVDVTVEVRVRADRLSFPDGDTQQVTIPAGDQTRVDIAARSLATGSVPVVVTVVIPDNGGLLTSAQLNVRSTAITGVGLVLSIGALLVLGMWWLRTWREGRAQR